MRGGRRAIVTGMIATYPVGGVVWDYGQYALALQRLGFDVYYLEDTGSSTYDPIAQSYGDDCRYGVEFLERSLTQLSPSLEGRWHFRNSDGACHGMSSATFEEVAASADVFLNVSGGTLLRDAYMANPCKILIDSDPGWNHFVNFPRWDANPGWLGAHGYRNHDYFFTYAERLGAPDCLLPDLGLDWRPTRPPVVLDCWNAAASNGRWTTVMTWNNFQKPVQFNGQTFGTKELEFPKIETLPRGLPHQHFEIAAGGAQPPRERWKDLGWSVIDSHDVSRTADDYRAYIQHSRGEISVAKNLYSATKSGWFSCRSVCYLAAGLPVVVQDTGFSDYLPTGAGLLSFSDGETAAEAVKSVESDYAMHCRKALEVAEEHFDSDLVVGSILRQIGLL